MALAVVLLAAVGLAACGSGGGGGDSTGSSSDGNAESGPITLGFAIAKSGFVEAYDFPPRVGAELAIEDENKDGGPVGRKFKMITADTKSKPELGSDAAAKVLGEGAEVVVTTTDYDLGAPAAIVATGEGVLAFSPGAASTGFGPSGIGPLAFTMATAASAEGAAIAEWAQEKKGLKSAYVLTDDSIEFDKQAAYGFAKRWEEIGGKVAGEETFKQEDTSVAAQINKIKSLPEEPEALYLASYPPGEISALKQIRAAGLDMPILANIDIDGDYWKEAVPNISDIYYTTYVSIYGDDPDPQVNELVERYEKKAGKMPDTAQFVTGYAMIQAIAKAVEGTDGSTDGTELQEALEAFKDEPLLLTTTFGPKYHIQLSRTMRIMQIQDGKTSFLEEWTPKKTPLPPGE
jgi:branched-chain amino acid transport system substrate-binding protein